MPISSKSSSSKVSASADNLETSMASMIHKFCLSTDGEFTLDAIAAFLMKAGPISSANQGKLQKLRKIISNELGRKRAKWNLVKVRRGVYCLSGMQQRTQQLNFDMKSNPSKYSEVDESFARIDFLSASPEPFNVSWPLNLNDIVKLYPKNLVIVGGSPNAGKTAFLLDFARLNMDSHKIKFFSSEMSSEELRERLLNFHRHYGIGLEVWHRQMDFREYNSSCLDPKSISRILKNIDPDGITIIDYLEIEADFYKIAGPLRQMHERLNRGVILIGLQKDPGVRWLRGKSFPLEKPRIVISLDYDKKKRLYYLRFLKAKAPAHKRTKPEDVQLWFDIEDGAKLVLREKPHSRKTVSP